MRVVRVLLPLGLAALGHAQNAALYPLQYGDSSILIGASQQCLNTFNGNVSCPTAIGALASDYFLEFEPKVLQVLCTDGCITSLRNLRNAIANDCKGISYSDVGDSANWQATYLTERAIFGYEMACMKNSRGEYCNTWLQSDATQVDGAECNQCYLDSVRMQAESPVEQDQQEMKSIYNSMSSSCSYTGLPVTKTVSGLLVASPTGTHECKSTYTPKTGDTVLSISLSQNVATHDLITANGLSYSGLTNPVTGALCIRNQCKVYAIRTGDTCRTIAEGQKISQAQLLSWNPPINGLCDNIANMTSQTICLSNPLGNFAVGNNTDSGPITTPAPIPADIGPQVSRNCGIYHDIKGGDDCGTLELKYGISLEDIIFLNPSVWKNCTNLWLDSSYCVAPVGNIKDYPGYGGPTSSFSITPAEATDVPYTNPFANTGGGIVVPIANDTRVDCWDYLWWNSSLSSPPSCWNVAVSYEISPEELVLWNPSLDKNSADAETKTYNYDCTITPSLSYCVGLASPTPTPLATLVPPSPRGAGEIKGCTRWFSASVSCDSHITALRMTLATFSAYNPSVKADCSGFVLGTYYCWSTSTDGTVDDSEDSVPSPTSSAPGNDIATPTPTQSGMVTNCNKFYKVVKDDGCWAIANTNKIDLNDFYKWNPAVKTDCGGLQPDTYVCIGTGSAPSPTTTANPTTTTSGTGNNGIVTPTPTQSGMTSSCNNFYKVIANDGCWAIANANKIDLNDFYKWNPAVKTDCSGLQPNVYVCIGTGSAPPPASTSTTPTATAAPKSTDGRCGSAFGGTTCLGTDYGSCCSPGGWCGSTTDHCNVSGCQSAFGTCTTTGGGSKVSTDGTCGGTNGFTCAGSTFGQCCSVAGWCGDSTEHCGQGCQAGSGKCTGSKVSTDGTCGGTTGFTCAGSTFGKCCSVAGWCGDSTDHCGSGCQAGLGSCSGVKTSTDGTCGGANGFTCTGATFGKCCSVAGWCGDSTDHCGGGCQSTFGTCT